MSSEHWKWQVYNIKDISSFQFLNFILKRSNIRYGLLTYVEEKRSTKTVQITGEEKITIVYYGYYIINEVLL